MLIVDPSYEIQDDLDNATLVVRLEECGRLCYKSEDKITKDSAMPFVQKIAAHGHNSVMEMAVVTLRIKCESKHLTSLLACQPKYLFIDEIDDGILVTGSIRAFREMYQRFSDNKLVNAMVGSLYAGHPYLFEGVCTDESLVEVESSISVTKIPLAEVEELPTPLMLKHRHVGVKFITNRAVTHEIVRHRPCSFLQESQRYCCYAQDKFDNQVTFIKPMFFEEGSEEYQIWYRAMEETEKLYLDLLKTKSPQAARTVLPNSCKTEIIVYCNLVEWLHIFKLRTTPAAEPSMREVMIPLEEDMKKRFDL